MLTIRARKHRYYPVPAAKRPTSLSLDINIFPGNGRHFSELTEQKEVRKWLCQDPGMPQLVYLERPKKGYCYFGPGTKPTQLYFSEATYFIDPYPGLSAAYVSNDGPT
ncbi:hypothetical protein FS749_009041 [Ceratobasidium sp. UAMH 11750]|nr:hypothetical protein FS749_009041 [Ceratobasidium sp. UAMH 11750]